MKCPSCGGTILDGASFCERCGRQVGISPFVSSQLRPQPAKDNKVIWIIAIVVILVVVVPLVLSAALYFMVLGFGGTSTQTPTSSLTRSTMTNGVEFTFAPMSKDTTWSDVTILLSDGYNTVTWSPRMTDLVNGTDSMWMESAAGANIGMLKVNITLVDLAGNGFVNQGDYFTLTLGVDQVFSVATSYTVTILHVPTGAVICNSTFTG